MLKFVILRREGLNIHTAAKEQREIDGNEMVRKLRRGWGKNDEEGFMYSGMRHKEREIEKRLLIKMNGEALWNFIVMDI